MLASRKTALLVGAATAFAFPSSSWAQQTPGDQSGTPRDAGTGQSAATSTQAPAVPSGPATPARARIEDSNPADIIVTARRVEERLQDVPISITVFNQQQLNNRNVVQGTDLATYTPSLAAGNTFGSQNTTFSIRGFYQDPGTQPSVGVYFADVVAPRGAANNLPIGDGAGPGDFFDLQNVQVLKGPQGTLFGRNTTGGAILLVPQKPTSQFGGYVEGSYGNHDMKRIQAVVNLPLGDRARFRIGVDHEDRDGFVHNNTGIGPRHFNDIGYTAARASLVLDLTPNLENYTIISYLRSDTTGDVLKLTAAEPVSLLGALGAAQLAREAGTGFYTAQSTEPNPRTLLTEWRAINTTTWRASDTLTIKNIASYAELRESYLSPIFGTDLRLNDVLPFLPNPTPITFAESAPYSGTGKTAAQSTFTEELQFQGQALNDKLNYQFGGYAEFSDPLGFTGSQSPVFANCSDSADFICGTPIAGINYTVAETKTRNFGAYAQATYNLTDKLKLTGGIRYTWDRERDINYLRTYVFPNPGIATVFGNPALAPAFVAQNPTIGYTCNDLQKFGATLHPTSDIRGCENQLRERAQKPTWLIDLDYKPTDDILLYAKWARGFRAGGLAPQAPAGFDTYGPEKVDDYEVGLKSTLRGPLRATFNVDGFYNNFSNQQLLSTLVPLPGATVGPASSIVNAGKSRIYGVEVDTSITPFTGLTLDGAYTYLHAQLRRVASLNASNGSYLISFPALAGDPLPLAPRHKFSVTGTYTLPLDPSIGRISLAATETYHTKTLSNYIDKAQTTASAFVQSLSYQPHVALLNLNANWNSILGSPIDFQMFATNVLGKKYFTASSGLYGSVQFETEAYGEARMFGGRLRYHFGR